MNDPKIAAEHVLPGPEAQGPAAMVICTDAAYDPDDAVSLALAAFTVEDLTVITSDETGGRRARWTRGYLDALGRRDVEVAAGPDLGEPHRFLMDDTIANIPAQSRDVLGAVTRACERSSGPVTWVGQGPMTNLAAVVHAEPGLADRIQVTQQGGWLDHYRDKTRASHNLRLDPIAAGVALRTIVRPRLLLSDFTGVDDITIGRDFYLYRMLTARGNPEWARWLAVGLARWFDLGKPSRMHDPLALSAALGLPFVEFQDCRVRIDPDARLYRDPEGRILQVATAVAYGAFMAWLVDTLAAGLGPHRCPAAPTRHCQWATAGSGATVEPPTTEATEGQGWKPFSSNQRRVLEAMADGEQLQARELYERLGLPRLSSAARTVNWFARHGYVERVNNTDDEAPGIWILTAKGTAAAANPDDGYQLGYDGLPA